MITVELVNEKIFISCESYSFGYGEMEISHGYVTVPPDLNITLSFKKIPEILHSLAIHGRMIEELRVYVGGGMPRISFIHVVFVKEKNNEVFLKALRVSHGEPKDRIKRNCKCGNPIHYWYLINNMATSLKLPTEIVQDMWNNELFQFMCCKCFKKKSKYISVMWINDQNST